MKSESDSSNDEIDELEALIVKRFGRGRGKYKGKLPIICFRCNNVNHIATRCPNREDKDETREINYKGRRDEKYYRRRKDDKDKKYYYIAKENSDNESESNDDEVVYVTMK